MSTTQQNILNSSLTRLLKLKNTLEKSINDFHSEVEEELQSIVYEPNEFKLPPDITANIQNKTEYAQIRGRLYFGEFPIFETFEDTPKFGRNILVITNHGNTYYTRFRFEKSDVQSAESLSKMVTKFISPKNVNTVLFTMKYSFLVSTDLIRFIESFDTISFNAVHKILKFEKYRERFRLSNRLFIEYEEKQKTAKEILANGLMQLSVDQDQLETDRRQLLNEYEKITAERLNLEATKLKMAEEQERIRESENERARIYKHDRERLEETARGLDMRSTIKESKAGLLKVAQKLKEAIDKLDFDPIEANRLADAAILLATD